MALLATKIEIAPGISFWPGALNEVAQTSLIEDVFVRVREAPFYKPFMPVSGKPFSVEETNFGPLGWFSGKAGYRYVSSHPVTGQRWPDIPPLLLELWHTATCDAPPPECCLLNLYRGSARMGLHQDRDEAALDVPVVSVSLGDDAVFRIGGTGRRGKTQSFRLQSGDILAFGGPARLAFHGIDRVIAGTSRLMPAGGRLNLTLRRVTALHCRDKKTPDQGADRASHAPLRAGAGRG